METLEEKVEYILIGKGMSEKGHVEIYPPEENLEKVRAQLKTYAREDIHLKIGHAILSKKGREISLVIREFRDDETDYLSLYRKLAHEGK